MINKLKSLINKTKKPDHENNTYDIGKREQLNLKYNHPDDYYVNDEFIDENELAVLYEKKKKKINFRNGYYVVGFVLAFAMIGYSLFNMISDSKYDITLLIQDDSKITSEEVEYIKNYIAKYTEDKNGDGEIFVDAEYSKFPAVVSNETESEVAIGIGGIEKALMPYKISICIGRENFLKEVDNVRPLTEDRILLTDLEGFETTSESTLNEYYIAVRKTVKQGDKYSPEGIKLYNKLK